MIRLSIAALQFSELFVSSVVHLLYGFYIFSTAVAGDISQALNEWFSKPNSNVILKEEASKGLNSAVDLPPIVLVHGIFGFGKGRLGGLSYFAGAETKDDRVLVPDLGSLTSIYDRARELFYYLKGGRVDYGEEHSKVCGHSQFGRIYEQGHYPEWDEDHPVHFVGHSAGAQVVRVLQQMLADKLCRLGVIIYDWFDIPWLKAYYNFGFDHFNLSWKNIGVRGLVDCLLGSAGPFASGDWILPDLTIQGSMRLNSQLCTFPNTYYFSYATKRTRKIMGITVPSGILGIHPLLFIRVLQMSQWRHPPDVSPPYKGYRYYKIVEGDHILFIVNRERAGVQFDLIYDSIFERCRKHAFRKTPPTLPNQVNQ
ncbi:hypothetical protein RJ639_039485 [Escallonia herrerae]|uniref:Lipase-like C-terminal domain-containing protein n=1 Tax=Escallonia herrerae TaxID=1293975 RepID=A0AA89B863_9ASTE|nr:hypothetical protein RJ639_039485 [Escallonia herrerae]